MSTDVTFLGVKRDRGVTLTTYHHLVPRSRMSMSGNPLRLNACMVCTGQLNIYFYPYRGSVSLELSRALRPK
jgi:hypothetical protein